MAEQMDKKVTVEVPALAGIAGTHGCETCLRTTFYGNNEGLEQAFGYACMEEQYEL